MADGILSGVRIIEWGDFVSAPWTSRLLADMGADVVKIEPPGVGDSSRRAGPFPQDSPHPEKSGLHLYLNLNKRSVTLDLASPDGRAIFRELVAGADVLIENHRPAAVEALGLTYDSLRDLRPGLIMVSISPFGQTGPYRDYVGSELVLFHMGGIGYETPIGEVTDRERQQPLKGPGYQSYFMAGWLAATSTFIGLFHRQANGLGQHIDISEHEAIASSQRPNVTRYSYAGEVPHREPSGGPRFKPCKDGYFAGLGVLGNDAMWGKVRGLMGDPEWAMGDVCASQASRRDHAAQLEPLIMDWMKDYTKAELFYMGQRAGISCFPVNTVADVYAAEQYQARGFFQDVDHPVAGKYSFPGIPFHFSDQQPGIRRHAPLLGEHNDEVLGRELGHAPQDLDALRRAGVI
jgi:crotonobetainyl-CoA:carnitine CoA-transferase CaiB-like acyl-CoA transferase